MDILEILQKALEGGIITQEVFDATKTSYEEIKNKAEASKEFTQEDLNKAITDRLAREKTKYETQIAELNKKIKESGNNEELEQLKIQLQEKETAIADLTKELEDYKEKTQKYETEKLQSKILSELQKEYGFSLPPSYKLEGTTEEEMKENAKARFEEIKAWKEELGLTVKTKGIGADSNPSYTAQVTKEQFRKMSYSEKEKLMETNPTLYQQLRD
jgi:exonuclease VII large subunit